MRLFSIENRTQQFSNFNMLLITAEYRKVLLRKN